MRLSYTLSVVFLLLGSLQAQDLRARSMSVTSTIRRGTPFGFQATWQNASIFTAGPHYVGIYESADSTITQADRLLTIRAFPSMTASRIFSYSSSALLPANTPIRTRYIGMYVDYRNQVRETNEANNTLARPVRVIAGPADRPDLVVAAFAPSTGTPLPLTPFSVSVVTRNIGVATAVSSRTGVYLSADSTITTSDQLLAQVSVPPLVANALSSWTGNITLPGSTPPGTRYLGAYADSAGAVAESSETNNTRAVRISVVGRADLRPDVLTLDRSTQVGGSFVTATYRVRNLGNVATPNFWLEFYVDTAVRASTPILARVRLPGIAAGSFRSGTAKVQIPYYYIGSSSYKFYAFADAQQEVTEISEANNVGSTPLTVTNYSAAPLQLEFVARRNTQATAVTRTEVVMSAARGGSVTMALRSRPLTGHWVLTAWSLSKPFAFDATTEFSLGLLNSSIFPLWFSRLDANGRVFPQFNLPKVALAGTLVTYAKTFALKPDFSGLSGLSGLIRFTLNK